MDTTEMNLLGALQGVVPLLEGAGVAVTGVEGVTWTLAHQGEELRGGVGGVGRSWGSKPLGLSGQYLRTCGLSKRKKRSPAPRSPELALGQLNPRCPEWGLQDPRACCWLPRGAGLVWSCPPSPPEIPHGFVKIKAGIFFFKCHETWSTSTNLSSCPIENLFLYVQLSEKKH